MAAIDRLLERLDRVKATGHGKWRARCPGHDSKSQSLSIAERDDRVLIRCFAGCEPEVVLHSIGLTLTDLYDKPIGMSVDPVRRPWNGNDVLDLVTLEATVIALIGAELAERREIPEQDMQRLQRAIARLTRLPRVVHT